MNKKYLPSGLSLVIALFAAFDFLFFANQTYHPDVPYSSILNQYPVVAGLAGVVFIGIALGIVYVVALVTFRYDNWRNR